MDVIYFIEFFYSFHGHTTIRRLKTYGQTEKLEIFTILIFFLFYFKRRRETKRSGFSLKWKT